MIFFKKSAIRLGILTSLLVVLALVLGCFILKNYMTPNDEWYACRKDNECTAQTVCTSRPINKKYVSRILKYNEIIESLTRTQCWEQYPKVSRDAFCKDSICKDIEHSTQNEWVKCKVDSDCIGVRSLCGGLTTVNRIYEKKANDHYSLGSNMLTDCFYTNKQIPAEYKPFCENNVCKGKGIIEHRGRYDSNP